MRTTEQLEQASHQVSILETNILIRYILAFSILLKS